MAILLVVAGCGSSSSNSSGSTGATAAASSAKAAAAAEVAKFTGPVKFISPGPPVDISKLAGKTIAMVTLDGGLPFVQSVFGGMKQAAAAAGVKVQLFSANGSTSTASQEIEQAVAAGAAAVVTFAVNMVYIPNAVKAAKKAGVPIVGALTIDANAPLEPQAAGEVSIDYVTSGRLLAAYAVANTDGPVHAAYQNLAGIDTFASLQQGIEAGMKAYCPSGCSLTTDDLNSNNLQSDAGSTTTSEIARNPQLNWIFSAIDGIAQFSVPGVQLAGKQKTVRIASINAVTVNLQFITEGKVQAVDVGNSNNWLGWAMVDRALRAAAGEPPAMSIVPIKLFDASNLKGADLNNEDSLFAGADYRADYEKLWKKS
jgi:ribose transport system substrate-binding protein